MKMLILTELAMKIIYFKKKKKSYSQTSSRNHKKFAIFKKKKQQKHAKDNNCCKVRGHCQYSGEYRNAGHSIRSLKYSVTK